jgi:hypothetical protein
MRNVLLAGLSALSLIATPTVSFARDHDRGGNNGWNGGNRGWDNRYDGRWNNNRYDRRHDDNDDAVAAGVIGLVLGAALGAALSHPEPRYHGPPQGYGYNGPPPPQPYYDQGYGNQGYGNQGYQGGQCFRRELQWDPRSRQNIEVTVPYPC